MRYRKTIVGVLGAFSLAAGSTAWAQSTPLPGIPGGKNVTCADFMRLDAAAARDVLYFANGYAAGIEDQVQAGTPGGSTGAPRPATARSAATASPDLSDLGVLSMDQLRAVCEASPKAKVLSAVPGGRPVTGNGTITGAASAGTGDTTAAGAAATGTTSTGAQNAATAGESLSSGTGAAVTDTSGSTGATAATTAGTANPAGTPGNGAVAGDSASAAAGQALSAPTATTTPGGTTTSSSGLVQPVPGTTTMAPSAGGAAGAGSPAGGAATGAPSGGALSGGGASAAAR